MAKAGLLKKPEAIKIKSYKKIVVGFVVVIAIAILMVSVILLRSSLAMNFFLDHATHQAQQLRVQLLCKTDHQALLKAGREILSQIPKDRLNQQPDEYRKLGDFAVPEGVSTPQVIRDLDPRGYIVSYDGYLTLEMHGGLDHFGVRIYPDDFKAPTHSFK